MSERKVNATQYVVLTIIALAFLMPHVWLVLASLDTNASQALHLPRHWTLGNFTDVLSNARNLSGFGVGLVISLVQSSIVVVVSGLAAYPLSRYHLSYKKTFMYSILFMTALPMIAVIVPVYKMFLSVHLLDSITGVILYLSASSLPYGIWLMKNFMDGVPFELEEAAKIEGAGTLATLKDVIAPLMFPGICVTFIYTFSGSWGNFFVPYILLSSQDKLPASVLLYQYFGQHGTIAYGPLAAFSIIYALPSILLYILSQNYMSKGFTLAGASKG
ncbi:MAG: carbohydrate ABC transporter permease [Spirochaetia bacterium]|jgi:multiple sugar transport system permease protein|nr:carbohydrate ABC transporter permease [Spirochaetia bacterium]